MVEDEGADADSGARALPPQLRLDELRASLDAARASVEQSRIASESLLGDIAALQSASDQAAKAVENYRQASTLLQKQRDELFEAVKPLRELVGSPEMAARLDQERERIEAELSAVRDEVPAAEQAVAAARADHERAKSRAEETGNTFLTIKDRAVVLAAQLQVADGLRTQAGAIAEIDSARAYVLLQGFDRQLDEAQLGDVPTYQGELDDAWQACAAAQEELRKAAQAQAQAVAVRDQLAAKLERQSAAAVDLILQRALVQPVDNDSAAET